MVAWLVFDFDPEGNPLPLLAFHGVNDDGAEAKEFAAEHGYTAIAVPAVSTNVA